MTKESLPLELLEKHRTALNLGNSLTIHNENDLFEAIGTEAESAIVFLPKSKALIDMTLALVSGIVSENGTIVLAGEKAGGIESAKKAYEKNIGPVEQKIVGNHSALYVGKNKKLGANKKVGDFLSYSPLSYDGIDIEIANLPGVFSAGELDEGTKLLLDHIPYDKQKILDIACGAGVIGAIYKKRNSKSEITLSDSSKLAVLAAKKTLEKNGIPAHIIESDVFDNIQGAFDLIVTNPPFHTGIDTDYSFIEKFAQDARKHLAPGGTVYIVANAFLPYREILEKHIGPTETIAETNKFKVYKSETGQ